MRQDQRRGLCIFLVNFLTLARLPVGIIAGVSFLSASLDRFLVVFVGFLLVSDILDGTLARRLNVTTRAGGILDYVIDRFNFYFVICLMIYVGMSPFLFLPFLFRDLVYIAVQVYLDMSRIHGTKAASILGTVMVYSYFLILNYWHLRTTFLDAVLLITLSCSLFNLGIRVFRLRRRLHLEIKADLSNPALPPD